MKNSKVNKVEVVKAEEIKEVKKEAVKKEAKCKVFVMSSSKGVTNQGMIPALKQNINDKEALIELYKFYPTQFKSSIKYLNNQEKTIIKVVIGEIDKDLVVDVKENAVRINNMMPEEHRMLSTILLNINNQEALKELKTCFSDLFDSAIDYGIYNLNKIKRETK